MLTVYCMNTGNHAPDREVHILKRMVDRHLQHPHQFVCITENKIDDINCLPPPTDFPGWWGKIGLHKPHFSASRNLWLDLDVVITGSLDGLVTPLAGSQIRIGLNWAMSGHGGCQSSMMYWEGDSARIIYDEFDPAIAHWPPINQPGTLWGDQEWATELRDAGKLDVEYFNSKDMISYKYHCQNGLPEGAKVVVFHGKPEPADVNDDWVKLARSAIEIDDGSIRGELWG